ncbi:MAG TPA: hypothetical protein VH538_04865 [Gaiellaceae bacterium]|jgi:hypothetical protein
MSLGAAKAAGPAAFRAATIINSALFGALQGHEVRKAVDRGNELAPEIARARHSGQGLPALDGRTRRTARSR